MNKIFFKIFIICILIVGSRNNFYSQNPAACANTQNLCTNSLFSFSASAGTGLTPGLTVSNPFGNPQAVNIGCMFTNVANPQWLMINITSSGNLGFSFGAFGSAFPQAGNYDWIMWPYSPTACNDIFANTLPPVACNWNCTGGGGTGMGTVPSGGSPCNFQPSIPVVQGQQFIVLITNPSGVNTPVSFANTGTAGMSCNPLLYPNLTACPGQLAVFTGTWVNATGGTYTLYPGAVVQTNPSFTVSSLVNQVYTVQAQGLNSALAPIADQTTFTLTINPVIPISITTPTNFCYGSNATFTLNPAGTGTFNVTGPSAPTTSFATTSIAYPNVTTPNIGTFTVAASYTNGCTGTQTTQVNVAPNHSITVSTSSNVCQGGTVNLTSSMPTATAYAWTGPSAYASGLQNPSINTIQPVSSGIYTVSSNINFNGIACPITNTMQIDVVATNTVAITPNFTLCESANLNLTSSAGGAVSYSWSGPGTYTSNLQNPTLSGVLPAHAGNYFVTALFSNGTLTCSTGAVSNVSIVATSQVTVAVPNNICQNATANLTVTTSPLPLSYFWSGPNTFTSNLANPSITNIQTIASGIYSTTATYAIGSVSCTTTGTNQINVVGTNTVAVTPTFTLCEGSNLSLTSSAAPAISYSWTGPGTYTSSLQNPVVPAMLPTGSGNYSVTALFSNGTLTCSTGAISNVSIVATSPVTVTVPNNICQNSTANLTVTTSPLPLSYFWSGPNTFTSNLANPSITNIQTIASGIYSTTATYAIGSVSCTTTGTNQINVVGTNTVAVTPTFTLCEGSNLNLTSVAAPAISYSWAGPGTYTSSLQNPVVPAMLPAGSGNYSVTALFSNGTLTCSTGAVSNVSIVATSPVTVTVPNNICQNATANLTVTTSPLPLSYFWSGPNTFTSNLANPSITNIQTNGSGVYSTTATYAIGSVSCTTTGTNQISVVGTNTVAVTPNFTLCEGSNLSLTSSAAPAISYSWSGPGTYTSATQNPVVPAMLPAGSGNYSVTALFSNGTLTCSTGAVSNVSIVATSPVTVTVPNNICQNATANLTVTTSPLPLSYFWSGPNTFTSNLANPSITNIQTNGSGVYSTTATYAIGSVSCTTTGTNQISVVGTNTVAVTPNFTLCEGSNLSLTSSAAPAISYSWSGPGTYTSATQNPVVPAMLPTGSGNYSVTALFSNGTLTCSTGAISNVSIVATSPVTVTVPNNICQNATANMTATATGATGFNWAGPNSFTSNIAAPFISNIQTNASGIYTATAMFSIGTVSCTTANTASISVVTTNTVSVATNFTVCEASNVNLTSSATGAISYSWNGPGTYTSAIQNPTINSILPAGAGNYTATAFFTNGVLTCTTNAIANVSVVATPTTTITYPANICQNSTANFTATAAGAISYTWAGPNSFTSTIATPSILNIQTNGSGIYTTTTMFSMGTVSCTTNATNQVNVIGTNTVAVSPNFTICAGANVNLTSSAASAVSYSWNGPGAYTSALQNPTINGILPSGTGNYTATAFFTNGSFTCSTSAILNGSVIAIPPLNVTAASSVICALESSTITASGSLNYTWTPAATLNTPNGATVIANPLVTTVYSITGMDASGCLKTNTISLVVNPQPTLAATNNTMCFGTSALLTVNGAIAYTWTPAGTLSSANGASVTATPPANTIYTVTGASNKGCLNTTTASVLVNPLPVLSTDNYTICYGNSTNVSVSGANSYTWTPASTLSSTNLPSVIANPLLTTSYTVFGKDLNGCIQSTISTVIVNSLPIISVISPSTICKGQNALMTASGAISYTWNSAVLTSSQSVNPIVSTTYSVAGQDANGCINTGTLFLNVLIQPTLNVTGTPTVCLGNILTLTATGGNDYNWSTGDTTNVIVIEPDTSNIYSVSSGISPCNSSTIFAVTVYTPQSPAPYADPPSIVYGSSSIIHANNQTGNPINWSFSQDIGCINCETNTVTPIETTIYTITTTDNNGCIVTNTLLVQVDIICGDAFVPSAFSPNGDGFNDFWCVYGNCITSMNIQLYNRWGEKIFENEDKNTCWDGTYNGIMQNDAVFIYQLKATFANGEKIIKKGNVTLKR